MALRSAPFLFLSLRNSFRMFLPFGAHQGCRGSSVFLLKEHDKTDYSHRNQLVHNASQESHFQYLADDKPDNDEHHNAREHVERTRFFHNAIEVVEHKCYQHYIDDVF